MSVQNIVKKLVLQANTELRPDVMQLLQDAARREKNKKAKHALKIIIANARIAKKERLAICQDTGLPLVFLKVGVDVALRKKHIDEINKAVARGYGEGIFRASTIDANNRISYTPKIIHLEFTNRKGFTISVFPKGFGSENKSKLKLFLPTASEEEIDNFVVEAVREAGPNACPPYIVGVGIGGTSDYCLLLAKEALLKNVSLPNRDTQLAQWEKRLYRKINALGIGPMGLGGKFTCLGVKIKRYPTHLAGLPVGVNISCHALRSATKTVAASQLK